MSENEKRERAEVNAEATEVTEAPAAPAAEKKGKEADKKPAKKNKTGFFARVAKWFKEMKSELKKVQWPTAKTVAKNTGIVILCVIIVGICIGVFDLLANRVITALLDLR